MILKTLFLQNFRSYKKKEFKFFSGMTLVVGPNTSGKTNLLEAIYLLATGKSFRAGVEAEMIRSGEELARVSAKIIAVSDGRSATNFSLMSARESGNTPPSDSKGGASAQIRSKLPLRTSKSLGEKTSLEIVLTTGQVGDQKTAKKKYLVNGVGKRRMDFIGQLRCVLFGPEDLEIVIGSPSRRREYLDNVLEQIDRDYRRANLSYQKGLRQRNKLLEQIREKGRPRSVLFFWDKLLIENGEVITRKREEFINFINQQPDYFDALEIDYDQSIISPQRLERYAEQEVAAGMTLVGPHRDDFRLVIRDMQTFVPSSSQGNAERKRDLTIYGSRGEQRTAVLSLKLAELEFIAEKTNAPSVGSGQDRPVLLLDDIFSELDPAHRSRIFEIIPQQQTIITTADPRLVRKEHGKKAKLVQL